MCVCGGVGGGGVEIVIDMLNQTHNRFKRTLIYFDTDTHSETVQIDEKMSF